MAIKRQRLLQRQWLLRPRLVLREWNGYGPRYYNGYSDGYATVATGGYYNYVRVDDGRGGWVWGRKYGYDWY